MATRKLKNFEFAGFRHAEEPERESLHLFDSFETTNGYVFLVAGSDKPTQGDQQVCDIICDRVRYYLDNDQPVNSFEAVTSALVYANGYLFEKARKEPGFKPGKASAICLLVHEGKVYYAWLGQVSIYLYTGKRRYPLSWPVLDNSNDDGEEFLYLGQNQLAQPGVCEKALVPVDDDMIFLGTGPGWELIREKNFCGILADSMPTHTKVQRLTKMVSQEDVGHTRAANLVSFYNLDQTERSFATGEAPAAPGIIEKVRAQLNARPKNSLVKAALLTLAGIIIAYMVYDIFLFNPAKPVKVNAKTHEVVAKDTIADVAETIQDAIPEGKPAYPADVQYLVKRGDTWGKIYLQYEVCSWFIRNHPLNAGKFDGSDNPVLNSTIIIPVRYSGSQRLNPNFYQEFTTSKVGNGCQNVNQAFKNRVDEKLKSAN